MDNTNPLTIRCIFYCVLNHRIQNHHFLIYNTYYYECYPSELEDRYEFPQFNFSLTATHYTAYLYNGIRCSIMVTAVQVTLWINKHASEVCEKWAYLPSVYDIDTSLTWYSFLGSSSVDLMEMWAKYHIKNKCYIMCTNRE